MVGAPGLLWLEHWEHCSQQQQRRGRREAGGVGGTPIGCAHPCVLLCACESVRWVLSEHCSRSRSPTQPTESPQAAAAVCLKQALLHASAT